MLPPRASYSALSRLSQCAPKRATRAFASSSAARSKQRLASNLVNIVEVGPRDGLQNEKSVVPPEVKARLIDRLSDVGLTTIESGSFVSPKWVPQMAGTPEVLTLMSKRPGINYPVLVPNLKGLEAFLELRSSDTSLAPVSEIAVFTAATDAFSLANTNCTVAESLVRLEAVARRAADAGLRVRGYVSVVVHCPYSGSVKPEKVREVSKALLDMGCYEVSLGDTVGMGTPQSIGHMLEAVAGGVPVQNLAGHFHDTYGMGVANVMTALSFGIRTIDSSIAGLGGCPYSPGATGNVATEDVLYALRDSPYHTRGRAEDQLDDVADVGWWISEAVGRENASRVGRAIRARKERERKETEKEKETAEAKAKL